LDRGQWIALLKAYLRKKKQPTRKKSSVVTPQKMKLRIWGGGGDVILENVTDYEACPEYPAILHISRTGRVALM